MNLLLLGSIVLLVGCVVAAAALWFRSGETRVGRRGLGAMLGRPDDAS